MSTKRLSRDKPPGIIGPGPSVPGIGCGGGGNPGGGGGGGGVGGVDVYPINVNVDSSKPASVSASMLISFFATESIMKWVGN
jgi:hypothetical protein